ncbi:MAG: M64 family metallopeptidase [Desulfosarcinaceae bacterium]|nr:M64 family metallopeptidase [Desulfosarcinaceae bacterium]
MMRQTKAFAVNPFSKVQQKICIMALTSLLVTPIFGWEAAAQTLTTIERNGPSEKRVDIVIIGDAYLASQEEEFLEHATALRDFMFDNSRIDNRPFPEYRQFFNVHTLFVPSIEEGVEQGAGAGNTALGATLDGDRRLSIDTGLADSYINALGFEAEMIFVPVNTNRPGERTGGADGKYAIYNADYSGANGDIRNTALHEMGHAFMKLKDEYADGGQAWPPAVFGNWDPDNAIPLAPTDVSCGGAYYNDDNRQQLPESGPNLARSPDLLPWAHWVGYPAPITGQVGAFEGGFNAYSTGVFRPSFNSKMRSSDQPFDPV